MSTRTRMEDRRPSERFDIQHGNQPVTFWVGYLTKTKGKTTTVTLDPGEVFIQAGRSGSDLEAEARDAGVALSLALQNGIDLKSYQHSMTRLEDGRAASIIGAVIDTIVETYGVA